MYKHYIKINEANEIVEIFSNMKRPATEDDIFIGDNVERHFTQINGKGITNMNGQYVFKYINNQFVEQSYEEVPTDTNAEAKDILRQLQEFDKKMPRALEDIYRIGLDNKNFKIVDISQKVLEFINAKKLLRIEYKDLIK